MELLHLATLESCVIEGVYCCRPVFDVWDFIRYCGESNSCELLENTQHRTMVTMTRTRMYATVAEQVNGSASSIIQCRLPLYGYVSFMCY